ncbi:hypothetical protein N5U18_02420 [Aliarcobacter butzleri]|uniref:hypothetical protein n=1 Tax=Aliarcobacter butzleri TaxID=28197 RepID=UPI0021B4292D|nr:hypothetical protein [Aliarcobacter butzleri]MCT7547331.1 hypothetical protein [Aliarcobacter butzleri]
MQELNMEPIRYSPEMQELRKRAKSLGITDKEIDECGNNVKCLENKIEEKEAEIRKRQEEINNSYSPSLSL